MSDPELTPEQDEQVRRLLAEARHDAPLPADVATRLDAVLADLSREQAAPAVIDLAARRRRRNAAALLLGAAAVVVGGFTVGQVIDVGDAGNDSADAGAVADRDQSAGGDTGGEELAPAPQATSSDDSLARIEVKAVDPLRLSSQNLAADLEAQLPSRQLDAAAQSQVPEAYDAYAADTNCPAPPPASYGAGELFPAYYDGIPAVLALRPPADGGQRADVLDCSTAATLATATLPRR